MATQDTHSLAPTESGAGTTTRRYPGQSFWDGFAGQKYCGRMGSHGSFYRGQEFAHQRQALSRIQQRSCVNMSRQAAR